MRAAGLAVPWAELAMAYQVACRPESIPLAVRRVVAGSAGQTVRLVPVVQLALAAPVDHVADRQVAERSKPALARYHLAARSTRA